MSSFIRLASFRASPAPDAPKQNGEVCVKLGRQTRLMFRRRYGCERSQLTPLQEPVAGPEIRTLPSSPLSANGLFGCKRKASRRSTVHQASSRSPAAASSCFTVSRRNFALISAERFAHLERQRHLELADLNGLRATSPEADVHPLVRRPKGANPRRSWSKSASSSGSDGEPVAYEGP
jgi:hypothetical protein